MFVKIFCSDCIQNMTSEEIKNKAFTGVIWSFINQFGTQILAIVPAMVLARLLSPSEYGIVAMAGIFNGLAFNLSTGGFSDALLQKKDADHLDYCSVYYFNLFINSFFYLIFFFLAPYCADFFDEPLVAPVMRVALLSLPLVAVGGVHAIILKRNLNFKAPALRNIVVQAASAIVAVVLAFVGCGVWALVIQGVMQTLGNSIINYYLCSWRPTLTFSMERLKSMFSYGVKIYISGLVNYGFGKATDTTVAKVYSPADLSFYNRAYSTANLFIHSFIGVINNVAFPAFARMQGDVERLRRGVSRFVSMSSMIAFLLMALLFVLAEPLFNFMYSSKWDAVVPYFRIVCVWGLFQPVRSTLEGFLRATGCAGLIMYNRLINNILLLGNVYLAWKFGITCMLYGQVCLEILQICFFTHFTNRFYGYGVGSLLRENSVYIVPTLTIALVAFVADYTVCRLLLLLPINGEMLSSLFRLLFSGLISLSCFILFYRTLNLSAYRELIGLASDVFGRRKPIIGKLLKKMVKK